MATIYTVDGIRGVLVKCGLASPSSRGFVAGVATAGVLYLAGKPAAAFREDGSMKPLAFFSPEPDATLTHFLLLPTVAVVATCLFT